MEHKVVILIYIVKLNEFFMLQERIEGKWIAVFKVYNL